MKKAPDFVLNAIHDGALIVVEDDDIYTDVHVTPEGRQFLQYLRQCVCGEIFYTTTKRTRQPCPECRERQHWRLVRDSEIKEVESMLGSVPEQHTRKRSSPEHKQSVDLSRRANAAPTK